MSSDVVTQIIRQVSRAAFAAAAQPRLIARAPRLFYVHATNRETTGLGTSDTSCTKRFRGISSYAVIVAHVRVCVFCTTDITCKCARLSPSPPSSGLATTSQDTLGVICVRKQDLGTNFAVFYFSNERLRVPAPLLELKYLPTNADLSALLQKRPQDGQ